MPKLKLIQHSGVIDEKAFNSALKNRRIAGAGIDVFEREPTPSDNPLLKPDHVRLTPHTAGAPRRGAQESAGPVREFPARCGWAAADKRNSTLPQGRGGSEGVRREPPRANAHYSASTEVQDFEFQRGKGGRWIGRWDDRQSASSC